MPAQKKLVDGELVDMTPEEQAEHDARAAAATAPPSVERLREYASERRWRAEIGGITRNGVRLPTNREGRAALMQARDMLRAGELLDENGQVLTSMHVTVSGVSMQATDASATAILTQIGQHVQLAFKVEASVLAGINATPPTITTLAEIDAAAWPSND